MPFNSRRARVARLLAPALFAIPSIAPALEQGDFGPDRTVGPKSNGFIVASSAQNLTPAGSLVILGAPVRAKAVALNPTNNTAAVLTMGAAEAVIVLDRTSGAIIQNYKDPSKTGSFTGITYSVDGTKLFFSQDNNNVVIANVDPATGALALASAVSLPEPPSGTPYSYYTASAINPGGIGVSPDGTKAYVALNAANTLGVIDVASGTLTAQIPVGNVPNQVVITADGHYAYVTNQGGRPALSGDFVQDSDGTAIVADPTDAFAITGTVSVVDLTTNTEVKTIDVGLQPVGLFLTGDRLYVANAYSDTVSVIDTNRNEVVRTIDVRVPVPVRTVGDEPTSITVVGERAYVTLSQSNAVAVIDLAGRAFTNPVLGYIPTAYYPASIAYDAVNKQLVVAEDKGVGTQEITTTSYGVKGYATHSDGGTISLIPVPNEHDLGKYTEQVFENNHWNLRNPALQVGREFVNRFARPVPVPRHIGEPSVIKHVFLVIKENRTYDQILGDVAYGNGDASLAVFGAATPNQHALVQRFPLLDNTYAPSRQSGDGHPWIINSGSFYANEILSPDWIRQYGVDALTYSTHGFLWSAAERAGLTAASYGEVHNKGGIDKNPATGKAYIWDDYYNTSLCNEGKLDAATCATLTQVPYTAFHYGSTIPSLSKILDPQYPDFNLTVPDQYRVDYWLTAFAQQLATNTVPNFNVFRICDDHTNGTSASYPSPTAYQADNDLAIGRFIEAISHSKIWGSSAIFIEEDDSQNGVDHVDGHRQPAYVISPWTARPQAEGQGKVVSTLYTQENINRTIENILGMEPLSQHDLVASPMFDAFCEEPDFTPFDSVPATHPLNESGTGTYLGYSGLGASYGKNELTPVQRAWVAASEEMMKDKATEADDYDDALMNHVVWYSATKWKRPYPGESKILWPSAVEAKSSKTAK